ASVQAVLQDEGYATMGAADGQEALHLLRASPAMPSVILLDWTMPIMDGRRFMQAVGGDPVLGRVPVVVLTALNDGEPDFDAAGATLVLRKPVRLEKLLEVVERFCPTK